MKRNILALPLFLLLSAGGTLFAQTTSLQGEVTDSQGAAAPETAITITNKETSTQRKVLSTAKGEYTFSQVEPGEYQLEAVKPGFRTFASSIRLQVSTPATLNIRLEVGQVTETVNVEAQAAVVNTQNATVGNAFTETQIKQLPLQTRNVVALLSLQPGVAPGGQVLGAKNDQNNVTLDGVDINNSQTGNYVADSSLPNGSGFNAALPVPLDSVEEFRTTVAGVNADQGRSSGGQVTLVTRGGTNNFHGTLYEYNRNTAFVANNWFNNRAGTARPALVRNQYGASIGGPIKKDRVFFFFNWESRKDRSAAAVTRTVPSETFKQGIIKVQLTNGTIVSLNPSQVAAIDPLHIGESNYVKNLFSSYLAGNDPQSSTDKGLNYSTLRFNAPNTLDNRVYVARMDFKIDPQGKHNLMLRGTLNNAANDSTLAQFPGQSAASRAVDNSRGLAARVTSVLSSNLVNVADWGYTRYGSAATGNQNVIPSLFFTNLLPSTRPSQRTSPTTNFVDDLTWTKNRHTVQFGVNFRFIENDRNAFDNLPSYSLSRNTLLGLGADINADVVSYLQQNGYPGAALSSGTNVTNAFGAMLGIINSYGATYNFDKTGTVIPFGTGYTRAFENHEFEAYVQDAFKFRPNLTLTYGLRYGVYPAPYEINGTQVVPVTNLDQFFADRVGGQALGIPSYALPTAQLSYVLGGPANNGAAYYKTDKNNFAPRLALAYSPEGDGLLAKLAGKGSVFRAGAGVLYDRYGSNIAVDFANNGSPGLATSVSQPLNTDFTSAYRYTGGTNLPALPAAGGGSFPITLPTIVGGFTSYSGISTNLKAPYQYLLNATYARPLPKQMSIEVGYVGRLSHAGILRQDYAQPLTNFKDPGSGQTWTQASGIIRAAYDAGLTPAQVKANPGLLPTVPFFENMFAKAKNLNFNGSATANYFYSVYGTYAGSDLDALNGMDRLRQADGTCISAPGCNTFFALQSAGLTAWTNAGKANYNGMILVLRRAYSHGWGFDFNYTWSHSIDNASGSEGAGGSSLQDAFNPSAFRGPSSFDIRHNITANVVAEIPVGRGKLLFSGMPGWLDYAVSGWQLSGIATFRTGVPLNISNGGIYPTNYLNSALGILRPGMTMPASAGYDQTGTPSVFASTTAVNSFEGQYPGTVGTRGILRGPNYFNTDLAVVKMFRMPWEGHRLELRGEAFNLFNNVNFLTSGLQLSLATPTTFGQFSTAADARVLQLALRYAF